MKSLYPSVVKFLNKWEWLVLIVGLVVIFRIPSLFEPHHYGDEEIYFVMGRAWREGVPLYAQAFDHKPPLIYIFAGIARSVFALRLLLMVWMAVHTVFIWLLNRELFDIAIRIKGASGTRVRQVLNIVSTGVFAFLTTWPSIEGNIANAELFMMMPVTMFFYLLLRAKGSVKQYLLAGLVAGVGLLFKVPVVFDFAGIAIWYFFFREKRFGDSLRRIIDPRLWVTTLGFVIPIGATVMHYANKGILNEYLSGALLINFGYVSSWSTSSYSFNPFASGLFVRGIIVGAFTFLLYILRARLNKGLVAVSMWYIFSLFGSLLSGRPYPHYLLQPVVPLAVMVPYIYMGWRKVIDSGVVVVIMALSVVALVKIGFWSYPTVSYYKNFIDVAAGKKSNAEYLNYFESARRNIPIAEFLGARMLGEHDLYIWGTDSTLYNLLDKLPAGGKYIVSFHVRDFDAFDEVILSLERNQPKYIVVLPDPIEFPELFSLLQVDYVQIADIDGSLVYLRL